MSLSSSITCSLGFLVTTFDLFLIYIPFPLRDVHSCTLWTSLITDGPISFLTLFIHSLVEVYRSSAKSYGLFFQVFIHRILLELGLEGFSVSKAVHIIAPIGSVSFLDPLKYN